MCLTAGNSKGSSLSTGETEGMNNSPWLDGALYPDTDIPDALNTLAERVDFLARLCAAWDFSLLPAAC